MKLTGAMRFALGQVQRHGGAHNRRSLDALMRRGLVAKGSPQAAEGGWHLTESGRAEMEAQE